jgi:hypothetical protein
MYIGWNKTSITNHYHLPPAPSPVEAEAVSLIDTQERKDGPRIDKGPYFVGKDVIGIMGIAYPWCRV